MNCVICGREIDLRSKKIDLFELCSYHKTALKNLLIKYKDWKRALKLNWKDYLTRVGENKNTGVWVSEVCIFLLSNEYEMKKGLNLYFNSTDSVQDV